VSRRLRDLLVALADPHRVPLGSRLALSFSAIVLLMVVGSAVAFWQLEVTRQQAERIYRVDLKAQAVSRVHRDILGFRESMAGHEEPRQPDRFVAEAARRRDALARDVDTAIAALGRSSTGGKGHAAMLLEMVRVAFPAESDALAALARAGDWVAVERRLDSQVRIYSRVTASLVEEIDAEVAKEQAESLEGIRRLHARAIETLSLTVVLTLALAIVLAVTVTRSITRPLRRLDAGAQALARGEFDHRVQIGGNDELASLGHVFNETALQLQELYRALRDSEAHFRSLIENASDLTMVLDASGRIVYASPSARRLAGYEPSSLVGRSLLEILHPEDTSAVSGLLSRGASPDCAPVEYRLRHADGGSRTLEAVVNEAAGDSEGGSIVVNSRDITERKGAERRAAELQASLRRSETMSAMGMLVAGVAHEVRNPLFAISATLDLMEARFAQRDEYRRFMSVLRTELERLNGLMNGLLAYGKPMRSEQTSEEIGAVVAAAMQLTDDAASVARVSLVNAVAPSLPPVRVDKERLVQVFQNLLQNAIQHSPVGGSVTVAAALEHASGREWIGLSVTDSGPGFPVEDLGRIFEPFFTRRRDGTGLGLAIVRRIVEEHGGVVQARNRPEGGAVVIVRLPCAEARGGEAA
jgi:PAS domain S-box-containing protein